VTITDIGTYGLVFKIFGYQYTLNYIFKHLNPKIIKLHIKLCGAEESVGYDVPHTLGRLKNLKHLVLEGFVKKIPESIGELEKLSLFSLYRNKVKTIPKEVNNLKSLEILDIRYTKIERDELQIPKNIYVNG
jgi:hypothetical protein